MIMNLEITLDEMQKKARHEGMREREREKDIARTALKKGLPIEIISEITGLTEEEIQKLKDQMN